MSLSVRRLISGASKLTTALFLLTCVPAVLLLLGGPATGHAQSQSRPVPHTSILSRSSVKPGTQFARRLFTMQTPVHSNKAPVNTGTGIVYTCDPSVDTASAGTCNYLNTTVAGYYNDTFTNANANIYITYGNTGLGSSTYYFNFVTYAQYSTAYGNIASKSSIQTSAQTALANNAFTPYGSDQVWIQPALADALGILGDISGGATGIQANGNTCSLPSAGCYNAIITLTNVAGTFYFDNLGGAEPADAYDFYGTVQHETDEVLGTSSCIDTQGPLLSNGCDGTTGQTGGPSVTDLFRYSSAGNLVLDSSLSTTPGAYFSYDGGNTNGAKGVGNSAKLYNTLSNGNDYADFVASDPDCGTNASIQDGTGCPGEDAGQNILSDGGAEINILTAIGYGVPAVSTTPSIVSPTTSTLLGGYTTFTWSLGSGADELQLYVGTTGAGSKNVYWGPDLPGTKTSSASINIPIQGATLYVRLWYLTKGIWQHTDYTYTEATPPSMTSPTNGTLLGGKTTFTWNPGSGFDQFQIYIGNTGAGSNNVYWGIDVPGTTTSISSVYIPANAATLNVRLWYEKNNSWQHQDYTYTEATPPSLATPTPGSTIGGGTTFTWNASAAATGYQIWVGTTGAGSSDVYRGPDLSGSATSSASINIPTGGVTLNVRLWYLIGNTWQFHDYTYTETP